MAHEMHGSYVRIATSHCRVSSSCGEVEVILDERPEVGLDGRLVLRGGRDDLRVEDRPVLVEAVAVVEQAARGLGGPVALTGTGRDVDRGAAEPPATRR